MELTNLNKMCIFGLLLFIAALEMYRIWESDPIEEKFYSITAKIKKPKTHNESYHNPVKPLLTNKLIKTRRVTDQDLSNMWNKYVVPKKNSREYRTQWQWISNGTWFPRYHSQKYWLSQNGGAGDISRIYMTKGAEVYDQKYNLAVNCGTLLTVNSIANPEMKYITDNHTNVTDLRYSGTGSEGDLYVLNLPFKQYDMVFLPQVMEHMYDPIQIVKNVAEHLRIGGYLFMSAPTYNIPHMEPIHFYHYQPEGFAMLCILNGLDILELDWYGNVNYIHTLSSRRYWANIKYYIDNKLEPFENEFTNVFQTWMLCQKNREQTVDKK